MKNKLPRLKKLATVWVFTSLGWTQTIPIQSESGLEILLGGEVETEFVDVEGPGGFENQKLFSQPKSFYLSPGRFEI